MFKREQFSKGQKDRFSNSRQGLLLVISQLWDSDRPSLGRKQPPIAEALSRDSLREGSHMPVAQ